jgi:signal transduction histidine kinase
MSDSDLKELQKDTYVIVIALVIVLSLILLYVTLIRAYVFDRSNALWWFPSLLGLATCFFSYRLYRRERFRSATYVLVGGLTLAIVSFIFAPITELRHLEIYLLVLTVIMAGLLISPRAGLLTATVGAVLSVGLVLILNDWSWDSLVPLLPPLILSFAVAGIIWLSFDQLTGILKGVLDSHGRAQQRTQRLIESQEELETAYKMLEQSNEQLKEAQKAAEQASEFKSRFIANLSHELRTPLSAIINLSYILSKGRYGQVNAEQQDYLMRIHEAGNWLLQIVNDLLDLAKIEAGQMRLFLEPVDLAGIAANAMDTMAGLVTDKPVELRQEIEAGLPKINGDGTRIRQILLNLLGNAIKHTDEGSITLRIARENADHVMISVIDTGLGIKPEDLERIFEEFKQTQEAFASRKLGTGLGLPISKKYVELHGGQLWGLSEYGKGSTFHFTLPIEAGDTAEQHGLGKDIVQDQDVIQDNVVG